MGSKVGVHVRLAVPRELHPTSAAICVDEMPAVRVTVYATSRIPGPIVGHGMEQIYNIGRVGRRVEYGLYAGGLSG